MDVKGGARETQAGGADLHCLCHSHSPQGAIERLERRKSKLRWTLSIKYTADFIVLVFFKNILFIFRKREREGEREGEKHRSVASHMLPTGD